MELIALIPAHNEAAGITATLDSLRAQRRVPDRVVVISDNSTDDTVAVAEAAGAEVWETRHNRARKAGALNQALARLLPEPGDDAAVLVMDADSVIDREFLATAERLLTASDRLGAVGGVFYGAPGAGVLGQFQRNEYTRYGREIARRDGRVMVLTGTASVIKARALREVADARGDLLPGTRGHVYDTLALTEDNELTLALKTLRWDLVSPPECRVVTEIMPSWKDLWHQRLRWQRGALENLRHYGLTSVTWRYWGQQAGIGAGTVAFFLYLLLVLITAVTNTWGWHPLWLAVGGLFLVERLLTVWRAGGPARLLALPLIPELLYDAFIQAIFVRSLLDILRGRTARWHHVGQQAAT
ncbi:glycosyltransferase family 2 protein [Streptomyces sp. NPDC006339]|uniref:glycosyltransferase family 2 protein n=1 Tax=Streptomyces sp. NPDC006339 TaxID=3156755 RepID=UPI0033A902CF